MRGPEFKDDAYYIQSAENELKRLENNFNCNQDSRALDIGYLYFVFSHTTENDMRIYLKEISRILNKSGKLFFTTFIEDDVTNFTINPKDHHLTMSGPLHVVQYQKKYLFSIIKEYDFAIQDFSHKTEADGQSVLYLSKL